MAKKQKGLLALAVILAALLLAFGLYFGNYYHADKTAQQAMKSSRTVKVKQTAEGYLFDGPAKKNAIIFYPGAKVETTAYAPLLKQIASQEADVFLVAMPLHMASSASTRQTRFGPATTTKTGTCRATRWGRPWRLCIARTT